MADRADLGIIDLTKVAAPDIRVKVRRADDTEAIYRVPGNPPSGLLVELMVLLREIDAADAEDLELISDLRQQVQEKVDELFALRNADYAEGELKLGDDELAALVAGLFSRYYPGASAADEEGGDRPTGAEEEPSEEADESETPSRSTPPRPRSERRSPPSSSRARAARSRSSTSSPT